MEINALDPLRLDREAAAILHSAGAAVAAILARRAALDRAGLAGTPLVVLLGEMHNIPAHKLHHLAVLDGLKNHERIALGYEDNWNRLEDAFTDVNQRPAGMAEKAFLRERDRTGEWSLKASLAYRGFHNADQTRSILYRFLLEEKIPVRFTDVSKQDYILDTEDPSTAASLRACFGAAVSNVNSCTPAGMRVRNHHMMALGLEFARESGARILLQHCGNNHILGSDATGEAVEHSLTAYYKRAGLPVLAMPAMNDCYSLPAAHRLAPEEILPRDLLPETRSAYDPHNDTPEGSAPLDSREKETAYLNMVLPAMNMSQRCLSVEEHAGKKAVHRAETYEMLHAALRP